jgi:ketosteroid isomerase-like protein
MPSSATTLATLQELVARLGRFDADAVAEVFAETIDWDVPGATRVPWTGRRSKRHEVAEYFQTLWSTCDTAQADNTVHQVLLDGADSVALGTFAQTVRATGRRITTPVALHITVDDSGLITRLHLYEDSYAVAAAFVDA